jgi:hypothetical protein
MKLKMILGAVMLLMITISSNSYADDFFYDYGCRKIEIRKVPNIYLLRTTVMVDDIETDLIKDKIYRHDMKVGLFTIVTSEASQDELENLEGVGYVSPGYVTSQIKYTGDIDTIFLSGLINVQLIHPDDVRVLERVAEEYHMDIMGGSVLCDGSMINCYMKEFYLLCRNSSSACNEVQIANILYNLGIFDYVYPRYMLKTVLSGGDGGSDGTLAVSKTSHGIPKFADITVRQTKRMLKIIGLNQVITSNFKVEFYSIAGKRQKVSSVYHPDGTISVNLPNHLTAGLYIIRINDGKNSWERRISVR